MRIYLAPLEGITGHIYRNAYHACFAPADKYFTPFLTPHTKRSFNARERNDLLPGHNQGMYTVPQVLTKSAADFVRTAEQLKEFGYHELNLNAGCPSGTVVSKKRGAGLLDDPEELDRLLDGIFGHTDVKVSVKTRIGMESPLEFEDILKVYNKYPLEELIVHARVREDYYKNKPHYETYAYAVEYSKNPLVYNGDIFSADTMEQMRQRFPKLETVMVGRGVIANPGLIGELRNEPAASAGQLKMLHDKLLCGYQSEISGERNVLFKMKEFWSYFGQNFPSGESYLKKLKKSNQLTEYRLITEELFAARA